jgi:hypothetical protein
LESFLSWLFGVMSVMTMVLTAENGGTLNAEQNVLAPENVRCPNKIHICLIDGGGRRARPTFRYTLRIPRFPRQSDDEPTGGTLLAVHQAGTNKGVM